MLQNSKLLYSTLISGFFIALGTCTLAASDTSNSKPVCITNDQFIVISQSADTVGDDIIARRKSTHGANTSCKIDSEPGDYRIAKAGEAKYVVLVYGGNKKWETEVSHRGCTVLTATPPPSFT